MNDQGVLATTLLVALLTNSLAIADADTLQQASHKVVKLYGAGNRGGVEGYGSGCLISSDGKIVTVLSSLLESNPLEVVLTDGRRYQADIIYVDSQRHLAFLSIAAENLPHFELSTATTPEVGSRIYAISNCFSIAQGDELPSVQRCHLSGQTSVDARLGTTQFLLGDDIYLLDSVVNNPGAAGGALIDELGHLLGIIGKEIRESESSLWINYAIKIETLLASTKSETATVAESSDRPKGLLRTTLQSSSLRGLIPLPDVLDATPAYIDGVKPGSVAEKAKFQPDDLVLFVNNDLIQSLRDLKRSFTQINPEEAITIVVKRGDDLVTLVLQPES